MKRFLLICVWSFIILIPVCAQHHLQWTEEGRKFFLLPGININYPLHDDMIRSHRVGAGISLMAGYHITSHYSMGLRTGFDYHWPRKNFPDDFNGSDTSRLAFSVLTIQCANIFHLRKGWMTGLDMGYGLPDTKGNHGGLGWIQEYDGVVRNYLATSLYLGKQISPSGKNPLILSMVFQNLFGERHAENSLQLRLEVRL